MTNKLDYKTRRRIEIGPTRNIPSNSVARVLYFNESSTSLSLTVFFKEFSASDKK